MSQWFKRDSKWRTSSPAYLFLKLIKQFQVATRSTCPDMTRIYHAWPYGRFIEIKSNLRGKKFIQQFYAPIFLEAVLAIGTMWEHQSNLKEKVNPSILKDYFSSRTDPYIFALIAPVLLDQSNKTSWVFSALKSTSNFQFQCTVSRRSDSRSKANFSCYHRSDAWSYLQ